MYEKNISPNFTLTFPATVRKLSHKQSLIAFRHPCGEKYTTYTKLSTWLTSNVAHFPS